MSYECPKCKNSSYEHDEISTTGGFWTRYLNVQNRKFTTVSCTKCGYTEIYKIGKTSSLQQIFDFLGN